MASWLKKNPDYKIKRLLKNEKNINEQRVFHIKAKQLEKIYNMNKYLFIISFLWIITTCFNVNAQCDTKLTGFTINGSGQANSNEAMSKAFDGNLKTKWCDNSSPVKYLELIFNEPVEICKMTLQHAQAGGESADYNTSEYRIQTYEAGEWIDVVSVTGNNKSTTTHEPASFTTIALRLQIDKATQTDNGIARIYEFEIFGKKATNMIEATPMRRVYPHKVTGSSQKGEGESMGKAFDSHYYTKWCANNSGNKWMSMTFTEPVKIRKIIVHHAGEGENQSAWNTRNFKFQAKENGIYQDIINVTGNNKNVSTHTYIGNIVSDDIMFTITQAEQSSNGTARVFEIEFFADYDEVSPSPMEAGGTFGIFPFEGNKILSVENSSFVTDTKMKAYTNAEVNSQRWIATKSGQKFIFQNAYTRRYLTASGTDVVQKSTISTAAQWTLTPVEGKENCYYIVSYTGQYLRKPLDTEGSLIILGAKSDNPEARGQVWKFVKANEQSNEFTVELRDEIINAWKDKFYMPATYSPAFKINSIPATGHVIERPGFWDTAENMEILLDAYETTQNEDYKMMYNEVFDNFVATQYVGATSNKRPGETGWKANDYNDDLAWLVIGMVRAHLLFGDEGRNYKGLAKEYFDYTYNRALLPAGNFAAGLLRWCEGLPTTNSCVNGPMEVAACYIAKATGDDSYYVKAKKLYELQRQHLTKLPEGIGHINDSWDDTKSTDKYNYWASTYNQGTFLGAAVMLYERYGDTFEGKATTYQDDAKKVIDYSIGSYFCDSYGVLKVCTSGGDLVGFKGILMRYVRKYIEEMPGVDTDTYKSWMVKNVLHAYNNRNSQSLSWSAWLEKSTEGNYRPFIENNKVSNQIYGAFGTGTVVAAAVNIPDVKAPNSQPSIKSANTINIAAIGKKIHINSSINDHLQKVDVYDLHGKLLYSQSGLNESDFSFDLYENNMIVIVKVQTNKSVAAKKLIINAN